MSARFNKPPDRSADVDRDHAVALLFAKMLCTGCGRLAIHRDECPLGGLAARLGVPLETAHGMLYPVRVVGPVPVTLEPAEALGVRMRTPQPLRIYEETVADARQFLADAAAADTHSSDVDPGRVDPWEER